MIFSEHSPEAVGNNNISARLSTILTECEHTIEKRWNKWECAPRDFRICWASPSPRCRPFIRVWPAATSGTQRMWKMISDCECVRFLLPSSSEATNKPSSAATVPSPPSSYAAIAFSLLRIIIPLKDKLVYSHLFAFICSHLPSLFLSQIEPVRTHFRRAPWSAISLAVYTSRTWSQWFGYGATALCLLSSLSNKLCKLIFDDSPKAMRLSHSKRWERRKWKINWRIIFEWLSLRVFIFLFLNMLLYFAF